MRALPTMPTVDLRGITSGMARCARQGAYAALDTDRDELDFDISEYLRRGQVFERLRISEWQAAFPSVQHHRPIPWTCGVGKRFYGEADGYHPETKRIIEIVSTVTPSADVLEKKILQAKTYAVLDREAESAVLDVIDPSKLTPVESIPIKISDDDRKEVRAKVRAVGQAIKTNGEKMPDRVCSRPEDARGNMCPFTSTCFAGWERPAPVELDSDQASEAARILLSLSTQRSEAKAHYDQIDGIWKQAQAAASEIIPPGKSEVGNIEISRTLVEGRTTFRYALAVAAGALDPGTVSEFITIGQPHERWSVKPIHAWED